MEDAGAIHINRVLSCLTDCHEVQFFHILGYGVESVIAAEDTDISTVVFVNVSIKRTAQVVFATLAVSEIGVLADVHIRGIKVPHDAEHGFILAEDDFLHGYLRIS